MAIKVELREVCTSTGGPRSFTIGGRDTRQLRDALAELETFRVRSDAVLVATDDAGMASGAWNRDAIGRLHELFNDEIVPSSDALFDLRDAIELAADPPEPFFPNAKEYVVWEAAQPREPGARRPDRWDLLATHGCEFMREPRPDHISKGPSGECFGNALAAVLLEPDRLQYVEGIAGGKGGPGGGGVWDFKAHAWVTHGEGQAIDVTWPPQRESPSYYGITFPDIEAVQILLGERVGHGLFGRHGSAEELVPLLASFPSLL